jgi:hypothetical protein
MYLTQEECMLRKLIGVSAVIMLVVTGAIAMLGMPREASALVLSPLSLKKSSLVCTSYAEGGTRQAVKDGFTTCAIQIRELTVACVNKKGNADPAQGKVFTTLVQAVQVGGGNDWVALTRNGSFVIPFTWTNEELIRLVLGPNFDISTLCVNRNWQASPVVTKSDVVATGNTLLNGYSVQYGDGSAAALLHAFDSCNPAVSGLTYVDSNGIANTLAGKLDECLLYRVGDSGGCTIDPKAPNGSFYTCTCQESGKNTGSLNNPPLGYSITGPDPSNPDCTGSPQVLRDP